MATKSDPKLSYALISLYETLYTEKYGKKPVVNRYREKWGMQDVIESVGFDRAKELLEYYFKTSKYGHPVQYFFMNFDNIDKTLEAQAEDIEHRRKLKELTKQMVEERDEHRSSSDQRSMQE
jgi:hypothetical protein